MNYDEVWIRSASYSIESDEDDHENINFTIEYTFGDKKIGRCLAQIHNDGSIFEAVCTDDFISPTSNKFDVVMDDDEDRLNSRLFNSGSRVVDMIDYDEDISSLGTLMTVIEMSLIKELGVITREDIHWPSEVVAVMNNALSVYRYNYKETGGGGAIALALLAISCVIVGLMVYAGIAAFHNLAAV